MANVDNEAVHQHGIEKAAAGKFGKVGLDVGILG